MGYDKKFRERVMIRVDKGHSQEETRKLFGLGVNTITQWKKLREETGKLSNRELKRSYRKIDPVALQKDVDASPDDFTAERAVRFGCSENGIRVALKRNKITIKKNDRIRRTK
jgi:transposase